MVCDFGFAEWTQDPGKKLSVCGVPTASRWTTLAR